MARALGIEPQDLTKSREVLQKQGALSSVNQLWEQYQTVSPKNFDALRLAAANPKAFAKKFGENLGRDATQADIPQRVRLWMRTDPDGYAGVHAMRSPSIGDVVVVFGGMGPSALATNPQVLANENALPPVLFGDAMILLRSPSKNALGCLAAGSDAVHCIGTAFTESGSDLSHAYESPEHRANGMKPPAAVGFDIASQASHGKSSAFLQTRTNGQEAEKHKERPRFDASEQDAISGLRGSSISSQEVKKLAATVSDNHLGPWHYKATFETQYWSWKWTKATTTGPKPGARHRHTATALLNELMVVVGGLGFVSDENARTACKQWNRKESLLCDAGEAPMQLSRPLGDGHVLHVPSQRWLSLRQEFPDGTMPPRLGHSATAVGTSVFVFGGTSGKGAGQLSDLWKLTIGPHCEVAHAAIKSDNGMFERAISRAKSGPAFALTSKGLACKTSDGLPSVLTWTHVRAAGDTPIPRSGHTALIL